METDYFAYPLGRALKRDINESLGREQEKRKTMDYLESLRNSLVNPGKHMKKNI